MLTTKLLRRLKIKQALAAPRHLARRRGFGIHSPFAFDFVRRVIAQPCDFYCYEEINRMAKESGLKPPMLRLIFRISLHFRPESYQVVGCNVDAVGRAVKFGSPEAVLTDRQADMAIIGDTDPESCAATLKATVDRAGIAVILNHRHHTAELRDTWSKMTCGMVFRGGTAAIIVARRHLPRQMFNLWI
ncbi:MAG: hypothetical protein NC111_01095 [Bacteroides sp.]|nr:hypothetical protein [Bacteroides sp.]MCM1413559.1 hypothetical protein [Bacteroides sp.]MCM1471113.1 hypothetical protein [Bacteroides sp.]